MDRRIKKTKRAIAQATLKLLEKSELEEISISQLVREADISRSTFYLHYQSVYSVVDELEESSVDDIFTICRKYSSAQVVELIEEICSYVKRHQERFKLLLLKTNSHFQSKIRRRFSFYDRYFAVTGADAEFTRYYYSFVINGALGVFTDWIRDGCRVGERQLIRSFFSLFASESARH